MGQIHLGNIKWILNLFIKFVQKMNGWRLKIKNNMLVLKKIFSGEEQVVGALKKLYLNQKDLILLKVETLKLDHLLWEQASDGNMFPHLYSLLDISNVVDEFEITLRDDGSHILPANF